MQREDVLVRMGSELIEGDVLMKPCCDCGKPTESPTLTQPMLIDGREQTIYQSCWSNRCHKNLTEDDKKHIVYGAGG